MTEHNDYTIENLFAEQAAPKQTFETSLNYEEKTEPIPVENAELIEQPIEVKINPEKVKKSAWFVTKNLDRLLNFVADEIAMNGENGFKTDEADLQEFAEYWQDILKDKGGVVPTWVMLLISGGITYGATFKEAFRARKMNKRYMDRIIELEAQSELENRKKTKEKGVTDDTGKKD